MQSELSLSFCLHWAKYFMFVLGEHQILILAQNCFQNKPPGIQLLWDILATPCQNLKTYFPQV